MIRKVPMSGNPFAECPLAELLASAKSTPTHSPPDSVPSGTAESVLSPSLRARMFTKRTNAKDPMMDAATKAFNELRHPSLRDLDGDLECHAHTINPRDGMPNRTYFVPFHAFINRFKRERFQRELREYEKKSLTDPSTPKPTLPVELDFTFYKSPVIVRGKRFNRDEVYASRHFNALVRKYYGNLCYGMTTKKTPKNHALLFFVRE